MSLNLPALMKKSHLSFPSWITARRRTRVELADYPIRTSEKLRFADTDLNGHVSNATFAMCCQNARMEVLYDRNRVPIPIDAQFVIARFEIEFLAEMRWPGIVEVGTRVRRVGRSSVTMEQSLFLGNRCVANAVSTVVLVDRSTRCATPWPDDTGVALRALIGPANTGTWRVRFARAAG